MESCARACSSRRSCSSVLVERVGDDTGQPCANVGLVAVANGFDQQFPQRPSLEDNFPENVEHLAAEGLARLVQLFEQRQVNLAFACFLGDQVPEMAHLGLPDAMDAPEPLFDPVGIPWQVVIHHQVSALEVDPLPGRVRRQKDLHLGIMAE